MLVAKGSICVVLEVKQLKPGLVSELRFGPLFTWGETQAPFHIPVTKRHEIEKPEGVIACFKQAC